MKIHASIIVWPKPGLAESAWAIKDGIKDSVDSYNTIYGDFWWAEQMNLTREGFAESRADVLMIVAADTAYHDWPGLIESARYTLADQLVGVYAPDFTVTGWPFAEDRCFTYDGRKKIVPHTDTIVAFIKRECIAPLPRLDPVTHRMGYHFDTAMMATCRLLSMVPIRDYGITVQHYETSGYDRSEAWAEAHRWTPTLPWRLQSEIHAIEWEALGMQAHFIQQKVTA